ncbi:MAG: RNA pseudouridine synthase [Treponema sp.]|nr:RNA pseudouridine synthase [Treponema sp.]MCL2190757.1 RNA pseudouridine synthase [Treponema sp.]
MKTTPLFSVIHEDGEIVAVNKAPGIAVCPDRWDESRERLDRLVAESLGSPARLFTVHRIDRDTSGLVLFAKNADSHRRLSLAFEGRDVAKRYIAVVNGRPPWKETSCDLPLVPNGNKRHMTIVDRFRGKKSLTRFALLGSAGNYSVLEALPETGRTHQIRVHAAALGFPVVCDPLYGRDGAVMLSSIKKNWRGDPREEKPLLARLGLHSAELSVSALVVSGETVPQGERNAVVAFRAPLPRDMGALVRQMEKITDTVFLVQ